MKLAIFLLSLCVLGAFAQVPCELCTFAVGQLEQWVARNATEQELEQVLDNACFHIPECISQINRNFPAVVTWFEENYTPSDICSFLGSCSNKISKAIQIKQTKPVEKKEKVGQAPTCSLCEYAIGYIDNMIQQNSTIQEIESELDQACLGVAGCVQIINANLPQVIQYVVNDYPPTTVCTFLGLCSSMQKLMNEQRKPKAKQGLECSVCTYAVTYIDSYVQQNATIQEIEAVVDEACFGIQACVLIINQNLPQIIQYLINGYPASTVCSYLGACNQTDVQPKKESPVVAKENGVVKTAQGVSCSICVYAIGYIEGYVAQNSTEQEIEAILDDACFGDSSCVRLINANLPNVIAYLEQQYPAQKVCQILGTCSQQKETKETKPKLHFDLHRVKKVSKH